MTAVNTDSIRQPITCQTLCNNLLREVWLSTDLLLQNKLTWLLVLGPVALIGDATGILGEAICFACSGIALIPCAERLSFVTEQVAAHTNGTIGALLNATFGNAPELLLSAAALWSGLYRVVQLAMLGSMLTNLLFVFGLSCLVGGLRWQVQELRLTSGNVSVGMLLVATAGSLLPAALELSGQMKNKEESTNGEPSSDELYFCRINAAVMIAMYACYLLFQLGTHKEEFDEEENLVETPEHLLLMTPHFSARHGRKKRSDRNMLCLKWWCPREHEQLSQHRPSTSIEMSLRRSDDVDSGSGKDQSSLSSSDSKDSVASEGQVNGFKTNGNRRVVLEEMGIADSSSLPGRISRRRNRWRRKKSRTDEYSGVALDEPDGLMVDRSRLNLVADIDAVDVEEIVDPSQQEQEAAVPEEEPVMSFWVGILWLIIITLCISAMSEILVKTIHGFARWCQLSDVFTTMVIVPFFSNVAEQVSAILFAYRNKMDLCVGVTVGSAIQIANFVLPGCVIVGMLMNRPMTLYFHGYETCCLFLSVICVACVLQGGTTNWLVGATFIGIYTMMAVGFWFHEIEHLSDDDDKNVFRNQTATSP